MIPKLAVQSYNTALLHVQKPTDSYSYESILRDFYVRHLAISTLSFPDIIHVMT